MKVKLHIEKNKSGSGSLKLYETDDDGVRRRTSLGIVLSSWQKKNWSKQDRQKYKEAEKICAIREVEMIQGTYKIPNKSNITFLDFFEEFVNEKIEYSKAMKNRSHEKYMSCLKHLKNCFSSSQIKLKNLDSETAELIKNYFLTKVSQSTANMYNSCFRAAINSAYKKGIIKDNPLKSVKGIKKTEAKKEFLTSDEIKKLWKHECNDQTNTIKYAFLFSCYTGLRLGDAQNIKWTDIDKTHINWAQAKTGTAERNKLHSDALEILNIMKTRETYNEKGLIFPDLIKSKAHLNRHIKDWCRSANIDKHITYHCSRHSFAVNLLTNGVGIFTVQKLMGHTKIETTLAYAKLIDEVKDLAIDSLPSIKD